MRKRIFDNRIRHRIPDVERCALWIDGVFYWLFGPDHQDAFSTFLEEEQRLHVELRQLLVETLPEDQSDVIVQTIFNQIDTLYPMIEEDLQSLLDGDPAARSPVEIIAAYPGFYAVVIYRVAHALWEAGAHLFARLIAEYVHSQTGIDIHPAAQIGRRFVIDHGTGVVIGETTDIGHDVKVYQGVTLGALSVHKGATGVKRHPTIGNEVVIYANATILGGETVIGDHVVIGGNVWITRSIPHHSLVFHKSELIVKTSDDEALPEPINFVI